MNQQYVTMDVLHALADEVSSARTSDYLQISSELHTMETRILASFYAKIDASDAKYNRKHEELKSSIMYVAQQHMDLKKQVSTIEQGQATLQATVATIAQNQVTLQATVAELQQGQARLEQNQVALQATVANVAQNQVRLEQNQAALQESVTAINGTLQLLVKALDTNAKKDE